MRPDNRARSRYTAREAASNPPPLRHLAHYLSIFVSLFIFILFVFSLAPLYVFIVLSITQKKYRYFGGESL